jgi:hypothetical protein
MHDSQLLPHTDANLICQSSISTLLKIMLFTREVTAHDEKFSTRLQQQRNGTTMYLLQHKSSTEILTLQIIGRKHR